MFHTQGAPRTHRRSPQVGEQCENRQPGGCSLLVKMGQWLCRVPPPLHAHRGCNVHPPSPRRMQWTDESLRPLGPSHAWGHQEH